MTKRLGWLAALSLLVAGLALVLLRAEPAQAQKEKKKEVWTDPADETLPADFPFQGEYVTPGKGGAYNVQVIALGKGTFQAVVYPGGLPGGADGLDGGRWDGKNKTLLDGKLDGDKVTFEAAKGGKRKYKSGGLGVFSATRKFPPVGQTEMKGEISGKTLTLMTDEGKKLTLTRTVRKSKTLGAKPPEGAVVLFDGTDTKAFTGGRLDEKTKWLNTDGHDIRTKQKFNDYTVHLEFYEPYRPDARDQGRGNSGFYQVDMYEVQILDSFGLEGENNECGGVYTLLKPSVNMCLPPLQWQTYDITFTNAVMEGGKKTKNARITAKLNGVVIHDDKEIKDKTGGARNDAEGTPGPLQLQGHGNPLQFRNFWVVEKK
jgi:Domain of Unknown Function (DUF1080)